MQEENPDLVTLRFTKFNDAAQFTADLFDMTEDLGISPINSLQIAVPKQYVSEYGYLIEHFNGREDEGGIPEELMQDRAGLSAKERAELNKKNAQRILEEANEFLSYARRPT